MRFTFIILLLNISALAQDDFYFIDGTKKSAKLISVSRDFVFYKPNDTAFVQKILKSELVLIVDTKGTRYLIATPLKQETPDTSIAARKTQWYNALGFSFQELLVGRGTLVYERYSRDDKLGLVLPLSLTFNPYSGSKAVNVIGGCDINIYLFEDDLIKLFLGPRFRYGTDVLFNNSEALTLQTQFGIRLGRKEQRLVNHLSVGFGFVRVISTTGLTIRNPREFHGWYSLNYRFSVKW